MNTILFPVGIKYLRTDCRAVKNQSINYLPTRM